MPNDTQCNNGTVPNTQPRNKTMATECFVKLYSLTIHLVLFYEIVEGIWWHGASQNGTGDFNKNEGVFKR